MPKEVFRSSLALDSRAIAYFYNNSLFYLPSHPELPQQIIYNDANSRTLKKFHNRVSFLSFEGYLLSVIIKNFLLTQNVGSPLLFDN